MEVKEGTLDRDEDTTYDNALMMLEKLVGSERYKSFIAAVQKKRIIDVPIEKVKEWIKEMNMEEPVMEVMYEDPRVTHIVLVYIPEGAEARPLRSGVYSVPAEYLGVRNASVIVPLEILEKIDAGFWFAIGNYSTREYNEQEYINIRAYKMISVDELVD